MRERPLPIELTARFIWRVRRARVLLSGLWRHPLAYFVAGPLVETMFARPSHNPPARHRSWRQATAALEFAMASPLLVILLGGAADYGLAQYYRTNLANAVAAGCEYAYLIGTGVTSSNIQTVVQNMMFLPSGATANLSVVVTGPRGYCVTGSGPTMSAATYPSTCSDGSAAGTYVLITATYTNTGLMHGFMSTTSQPITETATVRLN